MIIQYIFPTNPLRDKNEILRDIEVKNPKLDLVLSVSRSKKCGYTINRLDKNTFKNFMEETELSNRQEFPDTFYIDGSIYLGKWDVWYKKKLV